MDRHLYFGLDSQVNNKEYNYPTNFIKTSKYNVVTFLPYSLILQFNRMANIYFLIIAILSCFPAISPYSPFSSFAPLIFVITLSMIRDGYEDYMRHKSDNELNSSPATILTSSGFQSKTWKDVQVGDILKIDELEIISADIIVLKTAQDGICFIETSSLDGEKNLKPKQSLKETQNIERIESLDGQIDCIPPNPLLYNFDGTITLNGKKLQLNHKNFLLRGSRLKNVKYVYGIVVYTGLDTKIMRNSEDQKYKISNIDKLINVRIIYILLLQTCLCMALALLDGIKCDISLNQPNDNFNYFNVNYNAYPNSNSDNPALPYVPNVPPCAVQSILTFASYFLLLNTLIPISLIVSLEFVKVGQAYFMQKDKEMYSEDNDKYLKVFSTTINEELGQVQYVFTDKTGTLTCNKMEFKIIVCGEKSYGDLSMFTNQEINTFVGNQARRQTLQFQQRRQSVVDVKAGIEYNFDNKEIVKIYRSHDQQINYEVNLEVNKFFIKSQGDLIKENLTLLACCHECVLEQLDDGGFNYQGPSPDEIALVDAARRMNFTYKGAKLGVMDVECDGVLQQIELLYSFEFNSDRKRMSVIVRHGGIIKLYSKGADAIIKNRLAIQQPYLQGIDQKLEMFSKKGLRTLCLAMKVLNEQELQRFQNQMNDALSSENCDQVQQQLIDNMEKDLLLIGATAVEDKLQDDVPETLADFLKANINVWMLTGDKLETAENIGRSCNLLQQEMEVFMMTPGCNITNMFNEIADHITAKSEMKRALLIEGQVLAQLEVNQTLQAYLILLAPHLHTVICCRVTPKQKADMVRLVKNHLEKITLAVGDGANDVNMIQEAHIGIGIYGQEGMRAVQSSNYAIGQFRCLWKLILYHGRLNYIRIAEMILYFFYKNIIFTVPQLYYAFFCNLTGTSVFNDYYVSLYNTVFTFWPVVIRAIFDEDLYYTAQKTNTLVGSKKIMDASFENDILKQNYPKLYYIGQKNTIFTSTRFFKWFSIGIFQGLACFFSFYFEIDSIVIIKEQGYTADIWFFSIAMYTSIIILVTLKLALNTQFWTLVTWIAYIGTSLGTYFLYVYISSIIPLSQVQGTAGMLFSSPVFYNGLVLSVLAMFILDLLLFTVKTSKDNLLNYLKIQARTQKKLDVNKIKKLERQLADQYANDMEMQQIELQKQLLNDSLEKVNTSGNDQQQLVI